MSARSSEGVVIWQTASDLWHFAIGRFGQARVKRGAGRRGKWRTTDDVRMKVSRDREGRPSLEFTLHPGTLPRAERPETTLKLYLDREATEALARVLDTARMPR